MLTFKVFGSCRIRGQEGEFTELPPGKKRNLITHLLLHRNTWVTTEELTDAVWPADDRPPSPSGSLKTYVYQLRKQFPVLRAEGRVGGYRLTVEEGELDVDVFADLITRGREEKSADLLLEAFALWRGDPVFGPAAIVELSRLQELRRIGGDALADALLADGRAGEAASLQRERVTEDPLREANWQRLIVALRADGRPAEALTAYHDARGHLIRELGVEPGEALRDLHRELLAEPAEKPPAVARRPNRRWRWLAGAAALVILVAGTVLVVRHQEATAPGGTASGNTASSAKRPVPGEPYLTPDGPRLMFGMGTNAVEAQRTLLGGQPGLGMYTSWYDGPEQLPQLESWGRTVVPEAYRSGKAMHLVVALFGETEAVDTPFGPGCGRRYPLTDQFFADLERVARAFRGEQSGPPLYVSMFQSITKMSCADVKGYLADPETTNYYRALKQSYLRALDIFHANAPNARVALNWDGWQLGIPDDPELGAGPSMLQYFADEMAASDFQSFTAFDPESNPENVAAMVKTLGRYGKVMVSFFGAEKPGHFPREKCPEDLRRIFTPETLRSLVESGLFAWSFWTDLPMKELPECARLTVEVVEKYGKR